MPSARPSLSVSEQALSVANVMLSSAFTLDFPPVARVGNKSL